MAALKKTEQPSTWRLPGTDRVCVQSVCLCGCSQRAWACFEQCCCKCTYNSVCILVLAMYVCAYVSELLYAIEPLRRTGLLISTLSKPLLSCRSPLWNVFIIFCFSLLKADEHTRAVNQISHSVCHVCVLLVCKCHNYMIYGEGLFSCSLLGPCGYTCKSTHTQREGSYPDTHREDRFNRLLFTIRND